MSGLGRVTQGRVATGVVALALAASIAACGSSSSSETDDTSSAPAATSTAEGQSTSSTRVSENFPDYDKLAPPNFTPPTEQKRVALLLPSSELVSQRSLHQGFEDAAAKYNVELTVFNAGGYQNVAKQVSQMETAIGQKPDAIVVVPVSPVALNAQIAQASKAGILVTGQLIPPDSKDVRFSIVDPLPVVGELAAKALAERIGGKGEIYGIFGGAGGAPNTLFVEGALKALKAYPEIEMVFRKDFTSFNPADAQKAAENALAAHPNVKAILSNSTTLAQAANRVLQAAGKTPVPGAGIGPGDRNDIEGLEAGTIAVGVTTPFYRSSVLALQWVLAILDGAKPEKPVLPAPPLVITKDNIQEAISSGRLFDALAPKSLGCGPGQSEKC